MCQDNRITEKMRIGVKIDAPFPRNMELAYKLLEVEGFDQSRDFLHLVNQYQDQVTTVKWIKSTKYIDPNTKEEYLSKHFTIYAPDRYIPTQKSETLPEELIRSEEDI